MAASALAMVAATAAAPSRRGATPRQDRAPLSPGSPSYTCPACGRRGGRRADAAPARIAHDDDGAHLIMASHRPRTVTVLPKLSAMWGRGWGGEGGAGGRPPSLATSQSSSLLRRPGSFRRQRPGRSRDRPPLRCRHDLDEVVCQVGTRPGRGGGSGGPAIAASDFAMVNIVVALESTQNEIDPHEGDGQTRTAWKIEMDTVTKRSSVAWTPQYPIG